MRKLFIVGIGMGNPETITIAGQNAIEASRGLVGAKRMVDSFAPSGMERGEAVSAKAIMEWIDAHQELNPVAVLMSGDVGFFSGTKKLRKMADGRYDLELIPGISSLQYFCAKLSTPWEDAKTVSLHGRHANFLGEIRTHAKVFLLTDRQHTPDYICKALAESGLEAARVHVGEKLSYPEERIVSGSPAELAQQSFDPLSVLLIENPKPIAPAIITHGLADDAFIRGDVPMTKAEVRSVTLSKLQLQQDDVVYDIGAGTGSVSVEIAMQANRGQIYAIECKEEAISLIGQNKEAFGVTNLHVLCGMAPEAMDDLPIPDKAFIGGTKGNMEPILRKLIEQNPGIRVVVNVIALESLSNVMSSLKECGYELLDVVQLSAARGKEVGQYHLMTAENPIFILTAQGREA